MFIVHIDFSQFVTCLTHWGWLTHICVGKLNIIGLDNGLSPGRCQGIIWTNAEIFLTGPLRTNFNEMLIKIQTFSLQNIRLKMLFSKFCPFGFCLNMLKTKWDRIVRINQLYTWKVATPPYMTSGGYTDWSMSWNLCISTLPRHDIEDHFHLKTALHK